MPTAPDLPVVHNIAAKRFEINLDGKIAFSKYLLAVVLGTRVSDPWRSMKQLLISA